MGREVCQRVELRDDWLHKDAIRNNGGGGSAFVLEFLLRLSRACLDKPSTFSYSGKEIDEKNGGRFSPPPHLSPNIYWPLLRCESVTVRGSDGKST